MLTAVDGGTAAAAAAAEAGGSADVVGGFAAIETEGEFLEPSVETDSGWVEETTVCIGLGVDRVAVGREDI